LANYAASVTASDNCSANPNETQSPAAGTTFTGSQVVTLAATDAAGNTSTCSFTVTAADQTPPTFACPNNTTVAAGANCTATLANYAASVTASDNCSANPNETQSPAAGTTFTGSQVVTLAATDAAGNTSTCSFTVTAADQTPPTFACPASTTVAAGANCTATLANYAASVTASDNCSANPNETQSPAAGTTFTGSQVVTLAATDAAGNTSTCSFTVTVAEPTPPTSAESDVNNFCSNAGGNISLTATGGSGTTLRWYTSSCGGTLVGSGTPLVLAKPTSTTTYFARWETAGCASSSCASVTVTIGDAPTFTTCPSAALTAFTAGNSCSALVSYAVAASGIPTPNLSYQFTGVTMATGTGTGSGSSFSKGVTNVVITAQNNCGTSSCSFTVSVTDNENPVIICPSNIVRSTDLNQCTATVNYAAPTATDNCSGVVAAIIAPSLASGLPFPIGASTVIWGATDAAGNTKTCTFIVTVNDAQKPTMTCPANKTQATDPNLCNAVVTYATPKAADNCTSDVTVIHVSGGIGTVQGTPNSSATFNRGANTVIWRATDAAGNTQTCSFRVTVNDLQQPTLTCPPTMNVSTATNACNAVATYTNPSFTDNCTPTSGTSVRISGLSSGSTFPLGNSNVVFQATDAAGNTRRCTMVVTVADNEPPVVNCPLSVVTDGTGSPCRATVFYSNATASDNCAGSLTPFLLTGLASGSFFPAGVTTNTFRAVAPNGQSSDCSFSVTVNCGGSAMGNTGLEARDADLDDQRSALNETDNLELILAPNPALSTVTVGMEGVGVGGGTLLVFDAVGRLVLRQVIAEKQRTVILHVDGSAFAPGLYRVNLRTESGMVTKTLVVIK
jgi:hypothetical protein